jgi:hypothetical protein
MPRKAGLDERELAALRSAVDALRSEAGKKLVQSAAVQKIIQIVEGFLRRRRLICYGGTAINNVLPESAQFYDKEAELPDYDFFSPRAYDDAIALADLYAKDGYTQVEAKAGVHVGTYKVFVNFIPVADVTQLAPELFRALGRDSAARTVDGIRYAPPNYLRMAMYLELSRPQGDISRWEKVLHRLALLNKYYPLKAETCNASQFMRGFEGDKSSERTVYRIVRDSVVEQGLVFFGGYAATLYSKHMSKTQRKLLKDSPDFDVLSKDPRVSADVIGQKLTAAGLHDVRVLRKPGVGEIISPHYEVRVGEEIVCFIYEPVACHSYNAIKIGGQTIKVATIDTMLSFYLAFLYASRPYYDHARLVCMAEYLFAVQARNRFAQKGLLKRWVPTCYGTQLTLTSLREEKSQAFERLRSKRGSREWNERFLNYVPEVARAGVEAQARVQYGSPGSAPGTSSGFPAVTVAGYTTLAGTRKRSSRRSRGRGRGTSGRGRGTSGRGLGTSGRGTSGRGRGTSGLGTSAATSAAPTPASPSRRRRRRGVTRRNRRR